MPRTRRQRVSQNAGSYHIISRTVGGDIFFTDKEKEYLFDLLKRFASGFFVEIHAYCIMGNHFHILATGLEREAEKATKKELYQRYELMYPGKGGPPIGRYESNGTIIPDNDYGVERLRRRLGSVSRFVQEFKQTFSRWYNEEHERTGYLWGGRFKGIIVSKGEAELICSSYIDLNPVRADIVKQPEEYPWSSLGIQVRSPELAKNILHPIPIPMINFTGKESSDDEYQFSIKDDGNNRLAWYREFVYTSGSIKQKGKSSISPELVDEVKRVHDRLGIGGRFHQRVKNISEGMAIGSHSFISQLQEGNRRKFIRPRPFLKGNKIFTTRIFRE